MCFVLGHTNAKIASSSTCSFSRHSVALATLSIARGSPLYFPRSVVEVRAVRGLRNLLVNRRRSILLTKSLLSVRMAQRLLQAPRHMMRVGFLPVISTDQKLGESRVARDRRVGASQNSTLIQYTHTSKRSLKANFKKAGI